MTPDLRTQLNPAWYDAIAVRTSRRRFTGDPVPDEAWDHLLAHTEAYAPFPGVRVVMVRDVPPTVFQGVSGYLVEIRGAQSMALVVARQDCIAEAGYVGEAFILEAARRGIGTCWVVGSYHPEVAAQLVTLQPGEQLVAGTPLGITPAKPQLAETALRTAVRADRRRRVGELAPGSADGTWPDWAISAVEAVRLAPSGVNGQPWRFRMDDGALVVFPVENPHRTWLIDCGIAMLHAELGAQHAGIRGSWNLLDEPDVARFVPEPQ